MHIAFLSIQSQNLQLTQILILEIKSGSVCFSKCTDKKYDENDGHEWIIKNYPIEDATALI